MSSPEALPPDRAADPVLAVVAALRRQVESLPEAARDHPQTRDRLTELRLADAVLRYAARADRAGAFHLAVVGPTQTGKSTVVNLLLGQAAAEVSPLAGFTRHPHGFRLVPQGAPSETHESNGATRDELLDGFRRASPGEDASADAPVFYLRDISAPIPLASSQVTVIWDSPDFDSIASGVYQRGLVELTGLADAYLFVLSKEKYADLAVWKMLRLLRPLGRPTAVVLNKMTPDATETIVDSLRRRLSELRGGPDAMTVFAIEYDAAMAGGQPPPDDRAVALRQAVAHSLDSNAGNRGRIGGQTADCDADAAPDDLDQGPRALLRAHWSNWTAGLRAQHAALAQWRDLVAAAAERFLVAYRRDYLDHPQRYDSFRRATLELLHLLELPGVGGALVRVRRVVTWPVRQLFAVARPSANGNGSGAAADPEAGVLVEAAHAMVAALQRDVARRLSQDAPGRPVWQALSTRLLDEEPQLRARFEAALREHHDQVARDIHAAAGQLFEGLRAHPARLAALRAARTTLDVGMLALAVKTGGLSPLDAVYAPATFALSSLLVEEVAGLRMSHVSRNLRNGQYDAVRGSLVEGLLVRELRAVADGLSGPDLVAVSPGQLAAADRTLANTEDRHG